MELAEITPGQRLTGLTPDGWAEVVAVRPRGGGAVEITYRSQRGAYDGKLVYADDAVQLSLAAAQRRFDANIDEFRLASEAQRILEAAKYDEFLSVATSNVQPLPHQLKAVYAEMLPRVPLRFLLADDPGAGKTIMAGLYLKQVMLRDDVRRCLIVAPGGLVEQWQDELGEKFGIEFTLLTNDLINAKRSGSVFDSNPLLIARMDHLARNEDLREQLAESHWDLVVVDEAHRMSAHVFSNEVKKSLRFELGELLRDRTRHFLLMTATPHAGKEEDFQFFLSLLDEDTFAGRATNGVVRLDPSAFMRRMVKEDLVTLDGRPLFPQRVASTVEYELSPDEQELYEKVSDYVRTEMNRADKLDGKRKNTVGFALTVLQRRLASSPEAIYQSLRRRYDRLQKRRDETARGIAVTDDEFDAFDEDEEFPSGEYEEQISEVADSATSARTVAELDAELAVLDQLRKLAKRVRDTPGDVKWEQLRDLIVHNTLDTGGKRRKLIIFTEHRDTLEYLRQQIAVLLGDPSAVLAIHGGVSRKERRRVTAEFTHNDDAQFLIATDAAGEGLNLQAAHLMVNYDLPWNPNRLEQRFGRVHRIGQQETCQLWNLVASNTREGDVYLTLLRKIDEMSKAYQGKVFDVLGQAFSDGDNLKDLLIEAIRFGDDPAVRARMREVVNEKAGAGIQALIERNDLEHDHLTPEDVQSLRVRMAEAEARRLAPHFIHEAFAAAWKQLGGRWSKRGALAYEIRHVPQRFRKKSLAIASSYSLVTFDPQPEQGPDEARAALLAPGQPLHDEVLRQALEEFGPTLQAGAVFSSPSIASPHLLVGVAQEIVDGQGETIDRQFRHILVDEAGDIALAGFTPHLDFDPCPDGVAHVDTMPWLEDAEAAALDHVVGELLPSRLDELRPAREQRMDRLWEAAYSRLSHEISRLSERAVEADAAEAAGKAVKQSAAALMQRVSELRDRLDQRKAEIDAQRRLAAKAPQIVSYALVLPATGPDAGANATDTSATERRAVDKVLEIERSLGRVPYEQPRNNEGFDITSLPAEGPAVTLEVKGRIKGAAEFHITRSEVLTSKNKQPDYRLALVAVDPDDPSKDEVVYVQDPFDGISFGDYSKGSQVLPWREVWAKGQVPW